MEKAEEEWDCQWEKANDEEGVEEGVWVVLSGGQGDGGGRICLC